MATIYIKQVDNGNQRNCKNTVVKNLYRLKSYGNEAYKRMISVEKDNYELFLWYRQVYLLMPMDHVMLPHAKSAISPCIPCVITFKQQASGDIETTLLHRLTAISY